MRYLVAISLIFVTTWSIESMSMDLRMKFGVKNFDQTGHLEKSVVWNPATQEATVRMGLVPIEIDPILADKFLNLSSAKEVQIFPLDFPEKSDGCRQVSQWQFEFRPGLPDYLMYLILRGPSCQAFAESLEIYNTRLRFLGVSTQADPIDVSVEISR